MYSTSLELCQVPVLFTVNLLVPKTKAVAEASSASLKLAYNSLEPLCESIKIHPVAPTPLTNKNLGLKLKETSRPETPVPVYFPTF